MSPAPFSAQNAKRLADSWIDAWNGHDLDRIMAHYAPEVQFQTPTIIDTLGIADGRVLGADALREHFKRGLERLPQLRFALEKVYVGVRSVLITYSWHDGTPVAEFHKYNESELIADVQAHYIGLSW